jgi:hypothetical protein
MQLQAAGLAIAPPLEDDDAVGHAVETVYARFVTIWVPCGRKSSVATLC